MDPTCRQALEAILFVVDEPVDSSTLSQVLETSHAEVEAELAALAARLEEERRGFVLRHVAGGWRFYSAPEMAPYLERWARGRRSGRLSRASLETLAVIAYKQPVSRPEVGEIRGVNADGAIRTLVARGLIEEVGRDSGPGQAVLYGTTASFLEELGLNSLADLPPLTDFLPDGPAPDEPGPQHQRAARAAIRAGRELPSSGQARWEPRLGATDTEATARPHDDATTPVAAGNHPTAGPTPDPARARRGRNGELDALTEALEGAARNAIAVLETAVQAVNAPTELSSDAPSHRGRRPLTANLEGRADTTPAGPEREDTVHGARHRPDHHAYGETDA